MPFKTVSSSLVSARMVDWARAANATTFNNAAPHKTRDMCARLYAFASMFPSLRGDQLLAMAQEEGEWEVTNDWAIFTPKDGSLWPDPLEELAAIKAEKEG